MSLVRGWFSVPGVVVVLVLLVPNLFGGPTVNRQECDADAAMDKGCHLHDYDGEWRTHRCGGEKQLWMGQCFEKCGDEEYQYGAECEDCADWCKKCSGPESYECLECLAGSMLDFRGVCIKDCDIEGKYGTDTDTCMNCNSQCLNCFQGYDTTCLECREGSTLFQFEYSKGRTNSGYCLPNLQRGFSKFFRLYPNDNIVYECPSNCATCKDQYTCTGCIAGYNLYPPPDSGAQYAKCYIS